jgi:hypothetical protein
MRRLVGHGCECKIGIEMRVTVFIRLSEAEWQIIWCGVNTVELILMFPSSGLLCMRHGVGYDTWLRKLESPIQLVKSELR